MNMKYIITEDRLGEIVLRFLDQKDFVDDAKIEDGKVIIYLKRPLPSYDEIKELVGLIKTMFNYHGEIYKPSNPRWNYKLILSF